MAAHCQPLYRQLAVQHLQLPHLQLFVKSVKRTVRSDLGHTQLAKGILQVPDNDIEVRHAQALHCAAAGD